MDLDGARNAKAEIFASVFTLPETPRVVRDADSMAARESGVFAQTVSRFSPRGGGTKRLSDFGIFDTLSNIAPRLGLSRLIRGGVARDAADRRSPRLQSDPRVAIGIQRSRKSGDSKLVLIARDAKLRTHPLVERAISLAKGEARFVAGGEPQPLSFWQPSRRRPLMIGTSVSHQRVSAGTLGAFVVLADGVIGVISNNHVLADVNKAQLGDQILQPGRSDGGKAGSDDVIGTLLRFIPLLSGDGTANVVDCAVAALADGLSPSRQVIVGAGEPALEINGLATEDLFADDAVWKVGRTTGLTNGRVFAVEVDNYIVNMGTAWSPFRCRFNGQIQVYADDRPFAGPGDSGSLLADHDGLAHALLFAGSASGGPSGTGLATLNPLGLVLEKLDARLWIG